MRSLLVLVVLVLAGACARRDTPPAAGEVTRTSAAGDTLRIMTSAGTWGRAPIPLAFEAVSDSLRYSRVSPVAWGAAGVVWAAEANEIKAIRLDDGSVLRRFGREGGGPGEYQSIDGLYAWGNASVLALDTRAERLTLADGEGKVLRTVPLQQLPRYTQPMRSDLATCQGEVTILWSSGFVAPNAPPDTMIVTRTSLTSGSGTRIASMLTAPWTNQGNIFALGELYSVRNMVARGGGCRMALTQGLTPCVTLIELADSSATRVACWWREPAKPAPNVADPAQMKGLGFASRDSTMLAGIMGAQKVGERRSALETIRVDDRGRTWARATDPDSPFHPYVQVRAPETRSPMSNWDIIAPDGSVLGTVQVLSVVDVVLIQGSTVVGLRATEDGDTELVRADLALLAEE